METNKTICIALLCDGGKNAVVAIDRMLTSEGLRLQFEQQLCKIAQISRNCVVVGAGNALSPTDVLRDAELKIMQLTTPSIRNIANIIKAEYVKHRKVAVVDQLLKPRGYDSLRDFYDQIRNLPPDIYSILDDKIARFHIHEGDVSQLMVVGIDGTGAHIYLIFDPGRSVCFDSVGFNAIGSGEPHAVSTITSYDYTSKFSLDQALWIAYEAKKRAEKAPGVGEDVDLCVISPEEGVRLVDDKFEKRLQEKFESKIKQEREFLEDIPSYSKRATAKEGDVPSP